MTSPKRLQSLREYTDILPYDSELFGIYQPLLGWKSKRLEERFNKSISFFQNNTVNQLSSSLDTSVKIEYRADSNQIEKIELNPGTIKIKSSFPYNSLLLTGLAFLLEKELGVQSINSDTPISEAQLRSVITKDNIEKILTDSVADSYKSFYNDSNPKSIEEITKYKESLETRLKYESSVAGILLYLIESPDFASVLKAIFSNPSTISNDYIPEILENFKASSQASSIFKLISNREINPTDKSQLECVSLSPISVVHLFRQYFFELDSFLGTPVSHVWLSPGSTVELVEIQTRRTLIEKSIEQSQETIIKVEKEVTDEDELSDAIKQDNKQDTKFGASVTASYASIVANSSYDYNTSNQNSREEMHKRMRRQTDKLSSEIRKNYKSTFRTVTETYDSSSKRYVLTNTTDKLINYELRRKMRQIAVQVQDVGSYLCWQTYVDNPGESLGISKLIQIATPADLDGLQAPEEIPLLQPFSEEKIVTIPFISKDGTDADNEGEVYKDGIEVDDSEFLGHQERIQADFPISVVSPKSDYLLADVVFDGQGKPVTASRKGPIDIKLGGGEARFTLHLDSADFQGQNMIQIKLILLWKPSNATNDEIMKKNRENIANFKAREQTEFQKAFLETSKQRIKLLHQIKSRPSQDLREEERIVVYRKLIQGMLMKGISIPDDQTRHVVAELINSIFDIDKMLYFVSPEWWRPRNRNYRQDVGQGDNLTLSPSSIGWGGTSEINRDSYYITEDSDAARFGSSLGWLLQLDGDNMRNAFLNAPWVKAVIPIRPGKEREAITWLKGVEGMNGITDDDLYEASSPKEVDVNGNPLDQQKLINVIYDLAEKIRRKHEEGLKIGAYPDKNEVSDPKLVDQENVVTTTPIDRVYEHGFYPLKEGFRANVSKNYEIYDQWLEVMPTDQVVPVEVKYDPKTGRQA